MLIYVDRSKQVGDKDHTKVFANQDAAETWFEENDPEGVVFEYEGSGVNHINRAGRSQINSPSFERAGAIFLS